MRKLALSIMGLTAFTFSNVHAADNGIYIGAGIGQSTVKIDDLALASDFKGDDLGYKAIVVHDACATMDLAFGDQVVPAAQVHAALMAALAFAYATVTTTDAVLAR